METNKAKIEELIAKYNEGLADPAEIAQLEKFIESGEVQLTQLHELTKLDDALDKIVEPVPSKELDHNFYEMLSKEPVQPKMPEFSWTWISTRTWYPKFAMATMLIVAGFTGGMLIQKNSGGHEVNRLRGEVADLKEVVMLSLLEKESATDRLKAVNLTSEISGPSKQVTEALFKTLNADPSVNVRLAALEALQAYAKSPNVREGLVRAIAQQDSPLVQIALADLMAALQEKSSVKELNKILKQKSTPKEVKQRIQESINVLI